MRGAGVGGSCTGGGGRQETRWLKEDVIVLVSKLHHGAKFAEDVEEGVADGVVDG